MCLLKAIARHISQNATWISMHHGNVHVKTILFSGLETYYQHQHKLQWPFMDQYLCFIVRFRKVEAPGSVICSAFCDMWFTRIRWVFTVFGQSIGFFYTGSKGWSVRCGGVISHAMIVQRINTHCMCSWPTEWTK